MRCSTSFAISDFLRRREGYVCGNGGMCEERGCVGKKKKYMCFEVYNDNSRLSSIDKFAGQLRYIPNRFSVGRIPAINSLSLSFLHNFWGC